MKKQKVYIFKDTKFIITNKGKIHLEAVVGLKK